MKAKKTVVVQKSVLTSQKKRLRYSEEFKQQALLKAKQQGVAQTALDLGLFDSQIYQWRSQSNQACQTNEGQRLQEAEIAQLKREKAILQEEISFLKKATAYFAKLPK